MLYEVMVLFFFFSSRRRHTRFDCDWSSDVCSSDLGPLGKVSNNVAEYTGLIEGLRAVLDLGLAQDATVEVRMDSKLVVEQMTGRWKIKHADMRRLALEIGRASCRERVWSAVGAV